PACNAVPGLSKENGSSHSPHSSNAHSGESHKGNSMFTQLEKSLLSQASSINFRVEKTANGLRVIVSPEVKDKSCPALAVPLMLSGTAEDLDAGFVGALEQY